MEGRQNRNMKGPEENSEGVRNCIGRISRQGWDKTGGSPNKLHPSQGWGGEVNAANGSNWKDTASSFHFGKLGYRKDPEGTCGSSQLPSHLHFSSGSKTTQVFHLLSGTPDRIPEPPLLELAITILVQVQLLDGGCCEGVPGCPPSILWTADQATPSASDPPLL